MADSAVFPEQLLYIIIRFSASISDLPLTISTPYTLTTLSLKLLIRSSLPPNEASKRLRLIYSGKVLTDTASLSSSLNLPPPPSNTPESSNPSNPKGKGKAPLREDNTETPSTSKSPPRRVYIHCSISDDLTPAELEAEAADAFSSESKLRSRHTEKVVGSSNAASASTHSTRSTSAPPQGFDRLLSAGFSAAEVASLRSQFLSNVAYTRTSNNLPNGEELRRLEERWLDNSAQDDARATTQGNGEGWGNSFGNDEQGLDDLIYGTIMGFFWPLGVLTWAVREDGVWSRRRQLAILVGVGVNVMFGVIRWMA
ncbi:hypothetical protein M501DRAFT_932742 [Patellaria atrata CBS 101060]|uniref:Ubiquitin-like domain-containing protein n=1 Tax=Patellaria atrata CBS 101060 TaxID=1346257 RepID=A0A9P4SBA5_9PEZI|nr:hypothetical protein M501DRAFT_932742 [Patellaria atrata CBS 101060]